MNDSPDRRLADKLTDRLYEGQDDLSRAIGKLNEKIDRLEHVRRDEYNSILSKFLSEVQKVVGRIEDHGSRILVIETERDMERRAAIRYGAWAAIIASAAIQGLVALVKMIVTWK